jgi:hypothetical protein
MSGTEIVRKLESMEARWFEIHHASEAIRAKLEANRAELSEEQYNAALTKLREQQELKQETMRQILSLEEQLVDED